MLIALAAPGLLRLFAPIAKKYHRQTLYPSRLKRRFSSLEKQGFITIAESKGKTRIMLTQAGKQRIMEYQVDEMEIKKQTPWDKKWRYVFFDIPEKKKVARNVFRAKLKNLGFKQVQKSVWKHRYPCKDEVEFLARLYELSRYVNLVEARDLL